MKDPIIIVGASAAGVNSALTLRQQGFDGEIVLLSSEKYLPYERPAVSKDLLITGQAALIVPEEFYQQNKIKLSLNSKVCSIHPSLRKVELENGIEYHASKILLATGGQVRKLSIEGAECKNSNLHYVRSQDDALEIKEKLITGRKLIVIGGGLIGAEVVASAIHLGCEVVWVEAAYKCLTRALSDPLDQIMMDIHKRKGVEIITNIKIRKILHTGIELEDGSKIYSDLIVVGIGIEPTTYLGHGLLETNNGIVVNEFNETSVSNIYAAGDVANFKSADFPNGGRLEHWQHAQKHGASAAYSMLNQKIEYHDTPWFWTDQYEHHIEGCGIPQSTDDVVLRKSENGIDISIFYLRNNMLAAAVSLNRQQDIRAAKNLIENKISINRDQLEDVSFDLRKYGKKVHATI